MLTPIITAYDIHSNQIYIHPNVTDLPGLLVHVVLAVHNDVDHQPICVKSRQVG